MQFQDKGHCALCGTETESGDPSLFSVWIGPKLYSYSTSNEIFL